MSVEPSDGHGKPCYYCGEPCSIFIGNPSRWPVPLSHPDDPGVVKWHHEGCVCERLNRLEAAEAEVARLKEEIKELRPASTPPQNSAGTSPRNGESICPGVAQAGCEDCGAPYGSDGWCDVVIPNEVWNELPGEPTLLCFRCMTKRIEESGLRDVPVIIASGPYKTDANEEWRLIGIEHGERLMHEQLAESLNVIADLRKQLAEADRRDQLPCGSERPDRKILCQGGKRHDGSHYATIYWEDA